MAGVDWRKQERMKMASWIKPKGAHKAMVYLLLQRRIPIIFSIRGEESVKPGANLGRKPTKIFKSICNSQFPFEVTISLRLESDHKGYIDLSDPKSYKMEGAHQATFRYGDRISEEHGAALAEWAKGWPVSSRPALASPAGPNAAPGSVPPPDSSADCPGHEPQMDPRVAVIMDDARAAAIEGMAAYQQFSGALSRGQKVALTESGQHDKLKDRATNAGA